MLVKFKDNQEPCIVYKVLNPEPVIEYDEVLGRYCWCIEVEALGLVAKEVLSEAVEHPNNVRGIDIVIELLNE